jgi:hypothetical protein
MGVSCKEDAIFWLENKKWRVLQKPRYYWEATINGV